MKRIFVFFTLLLTGYCVAFAQKHEVDSLKKAFQKNKQDTTQVQYLFIKAVTVFLNTNVDSGMIYSRKALALSRKIHYEKGEVQSLSALANFLNISGDLPGSLKVSFEALPKALAIHEMRTVASCYNSRGLTYSTLKDSKKSLDNYYAAKQVVEKYHFNDLLVVEMNNICRGYLDMNRLDSAYYFNQKDYEFALKHKVLNNFGYLIRNFGIIESKKGNFKKAINFYRKSLADSSAINNHYLQSEDNRRIAEAYQKLGRADSSIAFGKKAFEQAQLDRNPDQVQRVTQLLTDEYLKMGDYKNAFNYEQVTLKARDSLFSEQKTLQVQNLAYNEEQRKQEVRAAEIAYQNRVRFYTLLGVVGVFALIAAILLFANTQRKKANTALHKTLSELKNTQKQLIQSEKMASLGELTAGIAHEI